MAKSNRHKASQLAGRHAVMRMLADHKNWMTVRPLSNDEVDDLSVLAGYIIEEMLKLIDYKPPEAEGE